MQPTLASLNPKIVEELVALAEGWKAFAVESPAAAKKKRRAPTRKKAKA